MRIRIGIMVLCLGFASCDVHPQTAKDAKQTFESQVLQKRLFLQGYSYDVQTTFRWNGSGLTEESPKVRTLAVVVPDSVSLKGDSIEIRCIRSTLERDGDGKWLVVGGSTALLVIELKGADPSTVFPVLMDQLFFTSAERELAGIPPEYKQYLPYVVQKKDLAGKHADPPPPDSCSGTGAVYRPPIVIRKPELGTPPEAVPLNSGMRVQLLLTIDEKGRATNPWISGASGSGLDRRLADALQGFGFRPATCNVSPIQAPVAVNLDLTHD